MPACPLASRARLAIRLRATTRANASSCALGQRLAERQHPQERFLHHVCPPRAGHGCATVRPE